MKTLALIPARSGSKGIPGKNFKGFAGKPLIEWAFDVAQETCDGVVLAVEADRLSDANALGRSGAKPTLILRRSMESATDDAPMMSVVREVQRNGAVDIFCRGWDALVLLQPTSPLRKPEHVREAVRLLEASGAGSVVSVVEIPAHYSPDYACLIGSEREGDPPSQRLYTHDYMYLDLGETRRQDASPAYSRDGTVYVIRREVIEHGLLYGEKCVPLIIPPHESANIDTQEDWDRAEALMLARLGR